MNLLRTTIVVGASALALLGGGVASASVNPIAQTSYLPAEGAMAYTAMCARFDGKRTIFACAPTYGPNWSVVTRIYEDGSATYTGGWIFSNSEFKRR